MAYYLTVSRNREYKKINILSISKFERTSKFKNESCSLEEIDNFTSLYDDEIILKKVLYENGLIDLDDIVRELSIRFPSNGTLKKVNYGVFYKNTKKYLDIDYLRNVLLSLSSDNEFLKKLVTRYRNSYCNNLTVNHIRNYLIYSDEIDINYYLGEFFLNEIFDKDYKTGEAKLKYKSLHDLAMFVSNYIDKMKNDKLNNDETYDTKRRLLQLQKECISPKETKYVKRKVLTKKQVEGQISLFD